MAVFVAQVGAVCAALLGIIALIEKVTGYGRRWLDRRIDARIRADRGDDDV